MGSPKGSLGIRIRFGLVALVVLTPLGLAGCGSDEPVVQVKTEEIRSVPTTKITMSSIADF